MKLATMMVALMAAVVSLAVCGNAFVAPTAIPALQQRNAGQALAPAASQPAPSRSSGETEHPANRRRR